MKLHSIKCVATNVKTDTGVCIGLAKIKQGEQFIIDGRTPESPGMCSNAFCALSNAAFVMMSTDSMPGETEGFIDRVCPHGFVTFRLSRSDRDKDEAYSSR
jgi:uncharacterized repeat protein (TIGR04076 family)